MKNKTEYDLISISHFFYPIKGGLENMAFSLLKRFAKAGYKCIAIHGGINETKFYKKNDFDIQTFKTKNIFNNTYPLFGIKFFKFVKKTIRENSNARIVVHSRHLLSSFLTAWICSRLKRDFYLVEHTAQKSFAKTSTAQFLMNLYDKTFSKYVIKKSKKIVCVSKACKKYNKENYNTPEEKLKLIYNGIDFEDIVKYKKDSKENIVVFAAKFLKVKDPITTYTVFKKLSSKYPKWTFYFIGDGEILKPEKSTLKNLKIINRMIEREEVLSLLGKSKIYINSSLSEALSIANIEATTLGNIPVFSDAPSNKEIAKKLNASEYIFTRQDVQDLEAKIEKAIKSGKKKDIHENISKLTKKHFDNHRVFREYEDLLFT